MTVLETEGTRVPEAPLVWKAVEYAGKRAPSREELEEEGEIVVSCRKFNDVATELESIPNSRSWRYRRYLFATREDATEHYLAEWLMARASDDVGVLLRYVDQLDNLHRALALTLNDGALEDDNPFLIWLILQGQSVFNAVVTTPPLALLLHKQYEHCHDYWRSRNDLGLAQVLGTMVCDASGLELQDHWRHLKAKGAKAEDFAGLSLEVVGEEWFGPFSD